MITPFWENEKDWNEYFLTLWHYQRKYNPVYQRYVSYLPEQNYTHYTQIPTLPITLFKQYPILTEVNKAHLHFESSTTTGNIPSKHYVAQEIYYTQSLLRNFRAVFGTENYTFLALLPGYLERPHASLVYMVQELIRQQGNVDSGFFIHNFSQLATALEHCILAQKPVIFIGVAFALVDFATQFPIALPNTVKVIETGGMKGRKKEWIKAELHQYLQQQFQCNTLYSEYGMTELLSQAYCADGTHFYPPAWMRVYTTQIQDPFALCKPNEVGVLNVVDAANRYSCAFIRTEDVGRVFEDGSFEVLGRLDQSELRGCSLLYV